MPDFSGMEHPPYRLCCGQPHYGVQCPDGKVMCCICFSRFPVDELHIDPSDGKRVDICTSCAAEEQRIINELIRTGKKTPETTGPLCESWPRSLNEPVDAGWATCTHNSCWAIATGTKL
jgi:hypothetical protein